MKVAIYQSGKNSCEVRYKVAGKIVRETVPADQAGARKVEVEQYLEQMTIPLSHDEAQEYRVAKKRLAGGDLIKAVDTYMDALLEESLPMWKVLTRYNQWCEDQDQARATISTKKYHLSNFLPFTLDGRAISEVTTEMLIERMERAENPKTYNNIRTTLMGFFNWARKMEFLPDGPHAMDKTFPKKVPVKDPVPFTPDELRLLMGEAIRIKDWDSMMIMALGAFAGVRMQEILRLKWKNVAGLPQVIILGSELTKTKRRRRIPVRSILNEYSFYLMEERKKENPMIWQDEEYIVHRRNPNRNLRKIAKACGLSWVKNGLRKGFVSYSTELNGAEQTAREAGHSVATLEEHYKGLVTKEDAKAWFNVLPACTTEISGV